MIRSKIIFEGRYEVYSDGTVKNISTDTFMKGTSITKKNRYVKVHIGNRFYPLHRLVAKAFLDNPDNKEQVNHIDGNRYNNSASNLEWCSSRENIKHAYKSGLKSNHGMKNPFRKLTEEDVIKIWKLKDTSLTARQIRDRLKLSVSIDAVKLIRQGKNWSSVTSKI